MSKDTELMKRLPWVYYTEARYRCEGYRWSQMSLRASRTPGGRERFRCKNVAHWHFSALKLEEGNPFQVDDGTYCWSHLWSAGIHGSMGEETRFLEWCDKELS